MHASSAECASSPTHKPRSRGWRMTSLSRARPTPYRRGGRSQPCEAVIEIKIRWCPLYKGIPGNEIAGGWAKQAASEPDDHGVEWLKHADKYGRRAMPPTSLAHLRRRASEKKWPEARSWCERRRLNKGASSGRKCKPGPTQPGRRSERPRGSTSSSPGMPSRACT